MNAFTKKWRWNYEEKKCSEVYGWFPDDAGSGDPADSMDFVEYDMTTGAETYFTVTVPGEDTGDLTMQGLAGEPEDADGDLTMPGYQGRPDPTPATAKKKNCWVKKGSYYYYYNSRGKLLRNGTYQIKGKN